MNHQTWDAVIVGGGIAGMATAARLQAAGYSTVVLEAHGQIGGCAGFYTRKGFSFDVGATTLVDFETGGVGDELLETMDLDVDTEPLPGYKAWLPDRTVTLHRDRDRWHRERLRAFGDTNAHRDFWSLVDSLAETFWEASRGGIKLPVQSIGDAFHALSCVGLTNVPSLRYMNWTMADALEHFGLQDDDALRGLLGMLIEDTVHSTVEKAPLINACLGITIRGAGLSRARGGMKAFWDQFLNRYQGMDGTLKRGHEVEDIHRDGEPFRVKTRKQTFVSHRVISAVPIQITKQIAPPRVQQQLDPYVERDRDDLGGAVLMCLGVPDEEVDGQDLTHHQLMHDYDAPLGNGNNMFISVSHPEDNRTAPEGYRSVMISTHTELDEWEDLSKQEYESRKERIKQKLLTQARRVYPDLGRNAEVLEVGTPVTYETYTHRPRGAVGGVRQTLSNSNQNAVPHVTEEPGFYLAGDTTWPGLGTVAGVLCSRIVSSTIQNRGWITQPNTSPDPSPQLAEER